MTEKLKEFTIDRSRWLHGERKNSKLYRISDSKMCCLGFCARAVGYNVADIRGKDTPWDLNRSPQESKWPKWFFKGNENIQTKVVGKLMKVNDKVGGDNREREREIARTFKKYDIKVNFIGKRPKK